MELTKEYFDSRLETINERIDRVQAFLLDKLEKMTTKMATKEDLEALRQQVENYADEVGDSIMSMLDSRFKETEQHFRQIDRRLDKIETTIQPQSYIVKDSASDHPRRPNRYYQMVVEDLARKGIKWPSKKYRESLDKNPAE